MVMEQARREKAPVPAEVVRGRQKAAVEEAAGEKVVDRAKERANGKDRDEDRDRDKDKGRAKAKDKDKVAHRISELLSE